MPEERLTHPAPPAPRPSNCKRKADWRSGDLAPECVLSQSGCDPGLIPEPLGFVCSSVLRRDWPGPVIPRVGCPHTSSGSKGGYRWYPDHENLTSYVNFTCVLGKEHNKHTDPVKDILLLRER